MLKTMAISLLLTAQLCEGVCISETTDQLVSTDSSTDSSAVVLSFETLEDTVRSRNTSIQAGERKLKGEQETDVGDSYIIQYADMDEEIQQYQKQIDELDRTIDALDPDETALRKTLRAQRNSLQSTLNSLKSSYRDLEDSEDDDEESHEKSVSRTERQLQNTADQLCMSAESTMLSLYTLEHSIAENERTLARLNQKIETTKTQVSLGMSSSYELQTLETEKETLLAEQTTLTTQQESLYHTLAVQCGYDMSTELTLADAPEVTDEQLNAMNYDDDLNTALENSYALWEKQDAIDQASDDYENNVTTTLYAYEAAKIEYDAEVETVTASFRELYQTVLDQKKMLEAAETSEAQARQEFTVQQAKYQSGMLSAQDYQEAQDTLYSAEDDAAEARIDLLSAYSTYAWALRGVISG